MQGAQWLLSSLPQHTANTKLLQAENNALAAQLCNAGQRTNAAVAGCQELFALLQQFGAQAQTLCNALHGKTRTKLANQQRNHGWQQL